MPAAHYCSRCLTTFQDDADVCPNLGCGRDRPDVGWGTLLAPGDVLDRHYHIQRALAVGGAGITYLARETDADGKASGPDLAIKVLYMQRDSGAYLRRLSTEAQILQELAHPNIVECRGFVQRTGHPPYLVTLFEHGGSLAAHLERVGPLPSAVAASILKQILLALDVAHQRGVVHRDLKPENVLLHTKTERDEMPQVRVADFGIAKVHGGLATQTRQGAFIGTPEYAAPEQFRGKPPTPATDVFAAGGLLYTMLSARPPVRFSQRLDVEQCQQELLEQIPPHLPPRLTEAREIQLLQEIVNHTMAAEPDARWTIEQVLSMLGGILGRSGGIQYHTLDTSEGAPKRIDRPPPPTLDSNPTFLPEPTMETPKPPPEPPPEPPPARRGGCLGLLAAMGFLGTLVVGSIASVGILVAAAFGFGWFSTPAVGAPLAVDPIVVAVPKPVEPSLIDLDQTDDEAALAERKPLEKALKASAKPIAATCKLDTTAVITFELGPGGDVRSLKIDPGYLNKTEAKCVKAEYAKLTIERTGPAPVRIRQSLAFF